MKNKIFDYLIVIVSVIVVITVVYEFSKLDFKKASEGIASCIAEGGC